MRQADGGGPELVDRVLLPPGAELRAGGTESGDDSGQALVVGAPAGGGAELAENGAGGGVTSTSLLRSGQR